MNWSSHALSLDGKTTKTIVSDDSRTLTTGDVLKLWQADEAFARFFTSIIAQSPFEAFFWETPPLTQASLDRAFEFVLVSAPSLLGLRSDPLAFAKHFQAHPSDSIVTFSNLGGDATLVVPAPLDQSAAYPHLAAFLRSATEPQSSALWRSVALALGSRLSNKPVWLSTAGMGVSWLHVRLDSQPKYYRHAPYRNIG